MTLRASLTYCGEPIACRYPESTHTWLLAVPGGCGAPGGRACVSPGPAGAPGGGGGGPCPRRWPQGAGGPKALLICLVSTGLGFPAGGLP